METGSHSSVGGNPRIPAVAPWLPRSREVHGLWFLLTKDHVGPGHLAVYCRYLHFLLLLTSFVAGLSLLLLELAQESTAIAI